MQEYRIWECLVCGWIYDESKGSPEDGIAPGTRWEDIPDDWMCPECGVGKDDFEMIEVRQIAAQETPQEAELASIAKEVQAPKTTTSIDYNRAPIVIVGTGLAGYNLARELRKLDNSTPLVMISVDDGTYYSKPQLSTAFHKRRTPAQLATSSAREMAQSLEAQILLFTRVSAIDTSAQTLVLESGSQQQRLHYGQLVLALGSDTIEAPVQGEAAGSAFRINDLQDFNRFYTAAAGVKSVLVIGGGLIGCEYANDLIQSGLQVDVVEAQERPLQSLLPERASALVQARLSAAGVRFHLGTRVRSIDYCGGKLAVTLENGTELQVDRVLSAIGVRPRTALAKENGIETARGIVTDRTLRTSAPNVFALGDCAEVDGHNLCYVAPLLAGARALAQTLTGNPTPVRYDTMPVSIKTTLCPVVVAPPAREAHGNWHYQRDDQSGVVAQFLAPDGQLLGFALVGETGELAAQLSEQAPPLMQI